MSHLKTPIYHFKKTLDGTLADLDTIGNWTTALRLSILP